MKTLLTIILLFSMALPASLRARVVESPPCAEAVACEVETASPCSCCQAGQCECHQPVNQKPAPPLPALPPRAPSAGDHIFAQPFPDITVRGYAPTVIARSTPALPEAAFMNCRAVPLYRWHCAILW